MKDNQKNNTIVSVIVMVLFAMIGWLVYSYWEKNKHVDAQRFKQQQAWNTEFEKRQDQNNQNVFLESDVLKVEFGLLGGDVIRTELKTFKENLSPQSPGVVILDYSPQTDYIAQSGILSKYGPDSRERGRATYTVLSKTDTVLHLGWSSPDLPGLSIEKKYTILPGSYVINLQYKVNNASSQDYTGYFYGQIRRALFQAESSGMLGLQMYQGGVLYTPDKPYKKISFEDMAEHAFQQQIQGGWAGMSQRYFLSAWVFDPQNSYHYFAKAEKTNVYQIGAMGQKFTLAPEKKTSIQAKLYVGPETEDLKHLAKGMDLTVDYGFLWPISKALLWVMKAIHSVVNNWGWSIVIVTLLIKLVFYKLSASSYRSMARLREVQPKLLEIKKQYENDKPRFSQAMVELYRKEKINPLGGCLPILIQIPFFIALYYVLLESVELRHAPFMLWIQDLAAKDPYYILPVLMGATMLLQQKMSPQPPDPIQAKMMMLMPVVFMVLFIQFPAGLVLYWVVNNILSIAQQGYITRSILKEGSSAY
jgi:YidC/Oxa1 family membrane protein insertase